MQCQREQQRLQMVQLLQMQQMMQKATHASVVLEGGSPLRPQATMAAMPQITIKAPYVPAMAPSTPRWTSGGQLSDRWRGSSAEMTSLLLRVMSRAQAGGYGGSAHHAAPPGLPHPRDLGKEGRLRAVRLSSVASSTTSPETTCDVLEAVSFDSDDAEERALECPRTTVMVRNIPRQYLEEAMLQQEWPLELGYDFLYLPRSRDGKGNLRYAFVNFVSEAHAEAFRARWHGGRLSRFNEGKNLNIRVGAVQGLDANVRYLKEKCAAGGPKGARQCQPIILRDGWRVDLQDF